MAKVSQAGEGRFVSNASEVLTGTKSTLKGNVKIMTAIMKSTSADIPELMKGLEGELASDKDLKAVWTYAEHTYDQSSDPIYKQAGVPKELHIALIAYVLVGFYEKFNQVTRELKSVAQAKTYPYKNYFKLLFHGVACVKGRPGSLPMDQKLYRGIRGHLDAVVGAEIAFQHFTSTTRVLDTALGYAGQGNRTLIVIEGIMASGMDTGRQMGISGNPNGVCLDHVLSNDNFECLLWPIELFKVQKIENRDGREKGREGEKGLRIIYLKA